MPPLEVDAVAQSFNGRSDSDRAPVDPKRKVRRSRSISVITHLLRLLRPCRQDFVEAGRLGGVALEVRIAQSVVIIDVRDQIPIADLDNQLDRRRACHAPRGWRP